MLTKDFGRFLVEAAAILIVSMLALGFAVGEFCLQSSLARSLFNIEIAIIVLSIYLRCVMRSVTSTSQGRSWTELRRYGWVWWALLFSVLPIIVFCIYTPLQGWDVLDYWAIDALSVLDNLKSDCSTNIENPYIHPRTMQGLLLIGVDMGLDYNFQLTWVFSSFVFFAVYVILIIGFGLALNVRVELLVIVAFMAMTLPLLQNHTAIAGYTELPMASACAVFLACAILWRESRELHFLILSFVSLLAPAFLRNNGIFYSIVMFLALIAQISFSSEPSKSPLKYFLGFGIIMAICGLIVSKEVPVPGIGSIGMTYSEDGVFLHAGYRKLFLHLQPLGSVLTSMTISMILNSSFSLLFVLSMAVFLTTYLEIKPQQPGAMVSVLAPMGFVGLIFIAQLVSAKFYRYYAAPGSDVGLSRFLLPWACTVLLSILYHASLLLPNKRSNAK